MTIPLAIVNCTFNVAGTRAAVNWLLCLNARCELAAMSERPLWRWKCTLAERAQHVQLHTNITEVLY